MFSNANSTQGGISSGANHRTSATSSAASGEPEAADDVAEVRWFAPDEIPPSGEFAFENTVVVLKAWKAGL